MLRKLSLLLVLMLGAISCLLAQDGKLAGKVIGPEGPLTFARVLVFQGDVLRYGTQTDAKGTFSIQPVSPGKYRVEAAYLTKKKSLEDVSVLANQTRNVTITFSADENLTLDVVEIFSEQPFETDPIVGTTLNNDQVVNTGTRNVQSLAALTAGVYQADEGESINIRGARSTSTVYYVDGVKIRGTTALPQNSIAQFQVITGGTPAEYGDFTGGVISITTANPSAKFNGNVELLTSEYLDDFGRSLVGVSLSGPLLTKTSYLEGTETKFKKSILGFFLNGEFDYNRDRDPAALGIFELKDGLLADLQQNPVVIAEDGNSFRSRANFVTGDDIQQIIAKPFNQSLRIRGLGRLDFQPADNILVKLGGNYEYIDNDNWGIGQTLFAPNTNSQFTGYNYRGWVRFQQSFTGGKDSPIRNLFYSIQADYSRYHFEQDHDIHGENYFDYGYIGAFDFDISPIYGYVSDPINDPVSSSPYWRTLAYASNNLSFDPTNTKNPLLANYNTQIFDHVAQNGVNNLFPGLFTFDPTVFNLTNLPELAFRQGLRNGDNPRTVYSIFSGIGARRTGFQKQDYEQFRVQGQATAEIKGHNLKVGFEFEQRVERFFGLGATSLWPLMRQYANFHLLSLEDDPSTFAYELNEGGEWNDTISVPLRYAVDDQKVFDANVRAKLGLPIDGTDLINIDALDPSFFSLDMFTADELLNQGLGPIGYFGYTYTGEIQEQVPWQNFFSDTLNRPQNAFAPTYVSAFVQDKFEFEDIIFNVGLRVDRFDANQPILNDPFSLHPVFSAGEVASGNLGVPSYSLPTGIDSDFTPYVNSEGNFSEVLGYRNGESWFDASGAPISSAELARQSGGKPIPALRTSEVGPESFKDYEPQTVFMPRISFAFPISDVASFFAHYDVLSQRPGQLLPGQASLLAAQISEFAFLENTPTATVTNPNLKPEITIDYEAGFKQRVGSAIGLTVSAFYREQRNMVRFRRFTNAWPFSYDTWDNLDFGTVKGFSFTFDMRRMANLQLRTSYTLQFADATGSDFNSARAVVNFLEGVGLLRTTFPINRDQRHRIVVNADYRFLGRKRGPALNIGSKTIYPLKQFGVNVTGQLGSGTPYSKNTVPVPSVASGVNIVNQIQGTPNGARLPWNYRVDLRADKSFTIGGGEKADGSRGRSFNFNVYVQALNVLNTLNIRGVYRFTGLPDDDGYLASDSGIQFTQTQIDPLAFVDQYSLRLQNPNNYTLPRRVRLGVMFNF